jgi:DNA-binding NtrC family response regulator
MPRILIVDDEPGIRTLLSLTFRRAGYEVKTASSPFKAMEICAAEPFDAVLSDVEMPGMDGHCLVRWISDKFPKMRSVLMSSLDVECTECPFANRCHMLRKPFRPQEAVAVLDNVLQR